MLGDVYWVVADIEAFNGYEKGLFKEELTRQAIIPTFNTGELIEKVKRVHQFDWGVFIAFPKKVKIS